MFTPAVLRSLLVTWAILALAFALTAWILSGLTVSGGFWGYVWVSALFGVVNAFIGTILRLLTFPVIILTLGLFSVIVNALLLELTDWLTHYLTIDSFFWTAIWAAIILSICSVALDLTVGRVARPE
jgi:putative membrane protein